MDTFIARHRHYWKQKKYLHSSFVGFFLFLVSLIVNRYASFYATAQASNPVTDLLLDNIPVMRVEWIVNDVAAFFGLCMLFLILWQPRRIPFILKAVALFVFIRSGFIIFTHLAPFPERVYLDPTDIFRTLTYGGDYFFSGHTGMSFLCALIYWQEKKIRYFCLSASVLLSVGVILGHLHYSIDVFAAFFITYGIFVMAQKFFPYAYNVFSEGHRMPELEKVSDLEKAVG
jgi:membrane-associated phospholipid phosphatase